MSTRSPMPHRIVALFGGLGYFSCLVQWLWCMAIILPAFLDNHAVQDFVAPPRQEQASTGFAFTPPPAVALIIGSVVTSIFLIITILVIIRLPAFATRRTKHTVEVAASRVVTATAHHKPLPKKRERILKARYVAVIKIVITVVPLVLLLSTPLLHIALETSIVLVAGIFFASWTLLWFGLQYITAYFSNVNVEKIY